MLPKKFVIVTFGIYLAVGLYFFGGCSHPEFETESAGTVLESSVKVDDANPDQLVRTEKYSKIVLVYPDFVEEGDTLWVGTASGKREMFACKSPETTDPHSRDCQQIKTAKPASDLAR